MDEICTDDGIVAIIPARMSSSRLPGKPLLPLGSSTVLQQVISRVTSADAGQKYLIATTQDDSDMPLREFCTAHEIPYFAGSMDDLLDRTTNAANHCEANYLVICSTAHPLLDPRMMDACARYMLESDMDFVTVARMPSGVSVEALPLRTLTLTMEMTDSAYHREQITRFPLSSQNVFDCAFLPPPSRLAREDLRLTLETPGDYAILQRIFSEVPARMHGLISVEDIILYMDSVPELRNHGRYATHNSQSKAA